MADRFRDVVIEPKTHPSWSASVRPPVWPAAWSVRISRAPMLPGSITGPMCCESYVQARMWLLAGRNEMHQDPVVFGLTDRPSIVAGLLLLLVIALAT